MKVVFVDRDGTLIVEPPDQQVDSLEKLELIPGVIQGLKLLVDRGYELVMVSNQDGLGTPSLPAERFELPQRKLLKILDGEGIRFSQILICPHTPADQCECRKPKTGLVRQYLERNSVDLDKSFVLGDRETDVELGRNIGCRTIRLLQSGTTQADFAVGDFLEACRYIIRSERTASIERKTQETSIKVTAALDGRGRYDITTGVGFFDHMLEQLSKHSMIDLIVKVEGDLHIDEHHTVEDTGLAVGGAIRQALGDKRGIERYGFVLPMDEALAQVAIDLSGRPYVVFETRFEREKVGDLPTELVEDFFRGFADGLRATINIKADGRNDHHKIEAIFKSVARALRQAVKRDEAMLGVLPSTKGKL